MSVIRVTHEINYIVLQKECLEDMNLSLKAKGLWAYLLTKPNDWKFYVSQLVTVLKEGKDAIYSAMKELINNGYCQRNIIRDDSGKVVSTEYIVSEVKKFIPQREKPEVDIPKVEDPQLPSIDSSLSIKNTTYIPPKAPKPQNEGSKVCSPSNEEKNRSLIAELKRDLPEDCKGLYIYQKSKLACDSSHGIDLSLLMPHEDFLRLILRAYDLSLTG